MCVYNPFPCYFFVVRDPAHRILVAQQLDVVQQQLSRLRFLKMLVNGASGYDKPPLEGFKRAAATTNALSRQPLRPARQLGSGRPCASCLTSNTRPTPWRCLKNKKRLVVLILNDDTCGRASVWSTPRTIPLVSCPRILEECPYAY